MSSSELSMNTAVQAPSADAELYPSMWDGFMGIPMVQGYIDAGGIRTRYVRAGRVGAPPLVLLHGTTGHVQAYAHSLAAHAEHFDVIAIDMVGHGFTDKPELRYEIDDYVQHLSDVLDAFGLERAMISGQSLGGWVAGRF